MVYTMSSFIQIQPIGLYNMGCQMSPKTNKFNEAMLGKFDLNLSYLIKREQEFGAKSLKEVP